MLIMYFKIILFCQVLCFSLAAYDNIFIVNYFSYKKAQHVSGLSCNEVQDDTDMIKNFSDLGIYSSLDKLHLNFTIKPFLISMYYKMGVFLDLRCYNASEAIELFNKTTAARLYGELYYWLILGNNLDDTTKLLNDDQYSTSTDVVIAVAKDEDFIMYDVYNRCKYRGGPLNVTYLGSWNYENGFNITLTQSKFNRRSNFHGMNLRVACVIMSRPKEIPLEIYLRDLNSRQFDSNSKFTYSIWLHLASLYNFTITPKEITVWKATNRNGPMIKMLLERSAELGGSTGILTPERLAVVTPIPAWPLRTGFIFRATQSKNIKVNHFLRPLDTNTWFLTIVLIVTAILVFSWASVIEHFQGKFDRYSAAVLFTIGSVCQQGSDLQITHLSGRIALLHTMIFSLLMYNYYSASVVSARLNEPVEKINDSLNELAKTNLKLGAEPSLYFNLFIRRSDWEAQQFYYKRWVKVPENERFMPSILGIKRILQGDFAYHIDLNVAYPDIERLFDNQQICQLTIVYLVRPTDASILMAWNGSFTELIKVGMAKMREVGLRARLTRLWGARTPQCRTDILVINPVTIYEAAPAFILLLFGAILGFSVYSIEKMIYCKTHHNHELRKKLKILCSRACTLKKRNKQVKTM